MGKATSIQAKRDEKGRRSQVMCHQIEQLKEEIKEKDQAMIVEHFKHQNISKEL